MPSKVTCSRSVMTKASVRNTIQRKMIMISSSDQTSGLFSAYRVNTPARNSRNIAAKAAAEAASAVFARIRSVRASIVTRPCCNGAGRAAGRRSPGRRGLLQQILVPGLGQVGRGIDLVGVVVERFHV